MLALEGNRHPCDIPEYRNWSERRARRDPYESLGSSPHLLERYGGARFGTDPGFGLLIGRRSH
jgi:hypothetical protein